MPLLDHFRPEVDEDAIWSSFHGNWATRIADHLTELLPEGFRAREHIKASGGVEIDVAAYRRLAEEPENGRAERNLTPEEKAGWVPPDAMATIPAIFPDQYEIQVIRLAGGRQLVGAIELVSPGNKDREETRVAFAGKVASYLRSGVSVIVVDVVTERRANLHDELATMIDAPLAASFGDVGELYAVAYRPAKRGEDPQIDIWYSSFAVGEELPTLPLRLTGELFIPVDLESSYAEACRKRKIARL